MVVTVLSGGTMFFQAILEFLLFAFIFWCFITILYKIFSNYRDREIKKQKLEIERLKTEVDTVTTLNQVITRLNDLETKLDGVENERN